MKDLIAGIIVVLFLLCLCVGLVYAVVQSEHKQNPLRFAAWSKLHPGTELTYDEWITLKNAKLLGNEDKK